jgi:hypothetical protein
MTTTAPAAPVLPVLAPAAPAAPVVQCCWCDAPATHNLDHHFDVACTVHFIQWYADDALGLVTPTLAR